MLLLLAVALQSAPAAAAPPPPPPQKKICRSDQVIGSRIPAKRVCRTQAEWTALARVEDEAGRIQMRQSMGMTGRLMNPGGSF